MTFEQWLQKQSQRNDTVGDLSSDVAADKRTRPRNTLTAWRRHLSDAQACQAAMDALTDAWTEYKRVQS